MLDSHSTGTYVLACRLSDVAFKSSFSVLLFIEVKVQRNKILLARGA